LDADDRLVPQAVDRNLRLLAAHSDWAFVSGEHRYIDHSGQVLQEWTRTPVANDHFARLLEGNYIGMCATVLYRRSALELFGGFDGRWNPCEDYDLYLRISRVHPIGSHGELIAEYRRYGGGMSDDRARMLRATISTLRAHARSVGDDTDLRAAYRKGLDWWRKYYGTPLGDDLRRQIRAGRFGRKAAADAMVLLAYSPLDFLRVFSVR
jgi:hypothetical protein